VTVQTYDKNGTPIGAPQVRTLEGFAQWGIQRVLEGTGIDEGYAVVTSGGGGRVCALGSVVDNHTNDPTTVMGRVAGQLCPVPRVYLPAVAHAPGAGGTRWRSDMTLYNGGVSPVTITVEYIPAAGESAGVQVETLTLQPMEMRVEEDVLVSLFGLEEAGMGTLRLTASDLKAVVAYNRIYTLTTGAGTYGQGYMAYGEEEGIELNGGTIYLTGLERSYKFRTNVGVLNVGTESADVLLAYESRGYLTSLQPGQLTQVGDIIRGVLGDTSDVSGKTIAVTVVGGTGRVMAYGSVVDNLSQDATFVRGMKR